MFKIQKIKGRKYLNSIYLYVSAKEDLIYFFLQSTMKRIKNGKQLKKRRAQKVK